MRKIAELNVLVRRQVGLPAGMKLPTDKFREEWKFATGDVSRLQKKIQSVGWNFIRTAGESLRSGVGQTSQEAISNAVAHALRHVDEHFNAAEVDHIELTQYPWFFLARVRIYPYSIQRSALPPASDASGIAAITPHRKHLPACATASFLDFGCAMPQLKEMLISTPRAENRPL
jgi:hypothetical protein